MPSAQPVTDVRRTCFSPLGTEPTSGQGTRVDESIVDRIHGFAAIAGLLAAALGTAVALGWIFGCPLLNTFVSGGASAKANTGFALIATGLSLIGLRWQRDGLPRFSWPVRALASLEILVSVGTLLGYVLGRNLGIDEVVFQEATGRTGTTHPGRLALNTAFCFLLIGVALLLLTFKHPRGRRIAQGLGVAAGVIGIAALLGYTFKIVGLYDLGHRSQMALPAAFGIFFGALGIGCATAECGLMAPVSARGGGGMMLRRLLPVGIFVPWAVGWLAAIGNRKGFYGGDTDDVLLAAALMIIFTAVLYANARAMNRVDAEREDTQQMLRRSSEQWQLTFDCMSEGLSYHDVDFNIVGCNAAFRDMLGGKIVEGRKCYEVVHCAGEPHEDCPMQKTLKTGRSEQSEIYEPNLGKHLLVRTDPVKDGNGKVFRVVHVVEDITERKKAEENISRLAAIVQQSLDAIFSADTEGRILSWNKAAEKIYGFTAAEAIRANLSILCPPEMPNDWRETQARIVAGQPVDNVERLRMRKDGSRFYVSLTVSPMRDAHGTIIGSSAIARDISESKRAEEERARLLELERHIRRELEAKNREIEQLNAELEERVRLRTVELEAANRELEAFSYSVSHDLRAPLRSLDGFSHILLDEYAERLDEEGRDFLKRLRNATQTMGQLIDALLQLSRVTRSEMSRQAVDLTAIARQIAEDLQRTHPERHVEFRIGEGLVAQGDPRLIHAVLQNLIGNGWKFTARREQAVIEFDRGQKNGVHAFFVRDNGAGFEMQYANKLFGAFQRLHTVAEFEGNGIGLATVQRIIRRHGGNVWAEGAPDQGATFYFTLA